MKAAHVIAELKKISGPERAKASKWFFKTGKGQYGEGDVFIGGTVPDQRRIAKQFTELPLPEIEILLKSKVHEHRLTGLIILGSQFKKADEKTRKKITAFYLSHTDRVNNWDLVDSSARQILGEYLVDKDRKVLYKLAKSKDLWEKRIAIVATSAFIARDDFKDTISISVILMNDTHDLIHKAVGWMLREMGKRDVDTLTAFLDEYAWHMPRTMLRYSIERLPQSMRKMYMLRK